MKSSFEEMGATYRKEGDHCLPDLVASDAPVLGIWGQRRRRFLMEYRNTIYPGMMLS